MSIQDLLDTPPGGTPAPRLTPRFPVSVKDLIVILGFMAAVGAIFDRLNKYAEKTDMQKVVDMQIQMRLDTQHNFDTLGAKVDDIARAQKAAEEKKARK
jgi:hypothetical protein